MKEFGNGEKDGVAGQWHSKELVELVEPLMDTAIDCILLHYMQT